MKNGKFLIFSFLLLVPLITFAYDDNTTHPVLTSEILRLGGQELTPDEKQAVISGSIKEDDDPRYLRHFYDPIHETGLHSGHLSYPSSKKWAQSDRDNDFTWKKGIYAYAWGNKSVGLSTLGHILHLIEDASVPDHTREDPHPPVLELGSPYEYFTKQFTTESFTTKEKLRVKKFKTLDSVFDSIAGYSNKNFFSKDTILDKEYILPKIEKVGVEKLSNGILYNFGEGIDGSHLVRIFQKFGYDKKYYELSDQDNLVLSDYWRLLSTSAIEHGIGVVNLFFEEVEKEKKEKVLLEKYTPRKPFLERAQKDIGIFLGIYPFESRKPRILTPASASLAEAFTEREPTKTEILPLEPKPPVLVLAPPPPLLSVAVIDPPKENPAPSPVAEIPKPTPPQPVQPAFMPTPGFGGGGGGARPEPEPVPEPGPQQETVPSTPPVEEEPALPPTPLPPPPATPTLQAPLLTITECASSLFIERCALLLRDLSISWSSPDTNIAGFELFKNDVLLATTSTSTAHQLTHFETARFSVRSFTENGIYSPTTTISVSHLEKSPMNINEIAWMGTQSSPTDEWVELFNSSTSTIDMSHVAFRPGVLKQPITLSGTVPPGGYYLIEADENAVANIPADFIATFPGGIADEREKVTLFHIVGNTRSQLDDTYTCTFRWCGGGDGDTFQTGERISPLLFGTETSSWRSNIRTIAHNGRTRMGTSINGTPRAKNSVSYAKLPEELIRGHVRLTASQSPYITTGYQVHVASGGTLALDPGVVIKMPSEGILVEPNGTLSFDGTTENPVVLTSLFDTEFGGTQREDEALPNPGAWRGIEFRETPLPITINNVIFRYGASNGAGIQTAGTPHFNIQGSTIEKAQGAGLLLRNSPGEIENSLFRDTDNGAGITILGSSPVTINNNRFERNTTGFLGSGMSGILSNNTFSGNTTRVARLDSPAELRIFGNTATSGPLRAISLDSYIGYQNATTTLGYNESLPYLFTEGSPRIQQGSALVIEPGVVIKMNSANLLVNGRIEARGTEQSPITFTSFFDDSIGGDTDGAGASTGSITSRIFLTSSSTSLFENVSLNFFNRALVYDVLAPVDLLNVSIANSTEGVATNPPEAIIRRENVTVVTP